MLLAFVIPLISGCLRVQVTLGVSEDDLVTGRAVVAVIPKNPEDPGPKLVVPPGLSGKVRVQEYRQDGYVGSQAFFSQLTFNEFEQLSALTPDSSDAYSLTLRRSGDAVNLDGQINLQSLQAKDSSVEVEVSFPARVATTNGVRDGENGVTWKLPPEEISQLSAQTRYADPHTRSFLGWAGLVGIVSFVAFAAVAAMAWMNRDQSPRLGRERTA